MQTNNEEFKHYTVLKQEAVDALDCQNGKIYIDATLGGGGHTSLIAEKILPQGRVIGFEVDEIAIKKAKEVLKKFQNVTIVNTGYQNFEEVLKKLGIEKITGGVLFDLGASFYQLTSSERGFSFSKDAPLDMRFNLFQELTAYDVVNLYEEEKLADIFYKYGEERYSRRLAKVIVQKRKLKKIETTTELASIISSALPYKNSRTNPSTRIFQAIRIEVNKELRNIEETLKKIVPFLEKGAKIVVISFHSLEDRIVKNIFRDYASDYDSEHGIEKTKYLEIITKKPICPSESEIRENLPSRSAKMRVARRV